MFNTFILYLIVINLVGFFIMLVDKKKAIKNQWRISERTLILLSILGGSIGMLAGMSTFRHKTKHKKFTIGIPLILAIQIAILIYWINLKW
jgi:uncharacterized membrane protein YsdA (DUF1294 family)